MAGEVVYLDDSAVSRLTDARLPHLVRQIEAMVGILAALRSGTIRLVSSDVLQAEVARTPDPLNRALQLAVLSLAKQVEASAALAVPASRLVEAGFHTADALHIAAAYTAGVDLLISCDAHFLRPGRQARIRAILGEGPVIVDPVEAARRLGL